MMEFLETTSNFGISYSGEGYNLFWLIILVLIIEFFLHFLKNVSIGEQKPNIPDIERLQIIERIPGKKENANCKTSFLLDIVAVIV